MAMPVAASAMAKERAEQGHDVLLDGAMNAPGRRAPCGIVDLANRVQGRTVDGYRMMIGSDPPRAGSADHRVRVANASAPSLQIVVMAAGQGKRMHSARPKALHPLAGRPLVLHVLDTARTPRASVRSPSSSVTAGDEMRTALAAPDPRSSHRIRRAVPAMPRAAALAALPDDGVTLITNGDLPADSGGDARGAQPARGQGQARRADGTPVRSAGARPRRPR